MSDFDKDALQAETSAHIAEMNNSFLDIVDLLQGSFEHAETKEDVIFIGNGAESVYQLLFEYRNRLDQVLSKARKQFIDMENVERVEAEFEAAIMSSLDKLPLTDHYDVR